MSEDDLVRRLQVGHDSGCAMSYGMHEHCCDCSYPDRQESAETILKLRQDLAEARQISGYDWDFLEAQAQSIRELQADLAAARADAERYRWIRDNHEVRGRAMEIVYGMNGSDWDAAIDAAQAQDAE